MSQQPDGIDWAAARDAYGSAAGIPALLHRAGAVPDDSAIWDDLWSRLCHQGTVYEASLLAIPALAGIARSVPVTAYSQPLNLLAAIAGSTDVHGTPDTRAAYAATLASCLPAAEAYAGAAADDVDFCYALSVVAGLRGERQWHQALTYLGDGQAPGSCPDCGEDLLVDLHPEPPRISLEWKGALTGPEITPDRPSEITGFAATLIELASRRSRDVVARWLLAVLGAVRCPECGSDLTGGKALGLAGTDAD